MIRTIESIINIFRLALNLLLALLVMPFSARKSIYVFLRFSGPTFLKLGQLLSSRPDLVGEEIAKILAIFQDKLPPFSYKKVVRIIEAEQGKKITDLFIEFDPVPVASASVAQVHRAKIKLLGHNNIKTVAVKILRPGIKRLMRRDITTLRLLSVMVGVFSYYNKKKLQDIIDLLEFCADRELSLMNEAAAASRLKENLRDVDGFFVPAIEWHLSSERMLVMGWIDGVPLSDKAALERINFDRDRVVKNLVTSYFHQVYIDGFFHADMHPGNLFLMKNNCIAVVDFGIVGIIDREMRIIIARIFDAFLKRDYQEVARLHIEAALVPPNTNIDEFALQCRVIGESVVDLQVRQVSLAKLLGRLLVMTKKYNMQTRAELLLLQKAMMLVEGVGMSLKPDLNIWELARPWMKEWAFKNIGLVATIKEQLIKLLRA